MFKRKIRSSVSQLTAKSKRKTRNSSELRTAFPGLPLYVVESSSSSPSGVSKTSSNHTNSVEAGRMRTQTEVFVKSSFQIKHSSSPSSGRSGVMNRNSTSASNKDTFLSRHSASSSSKQVNSSGSGSGSNFRSRMKKGESFLGRSEVFKEEEEEVEERYYEPLVHSPLHKELKVAFNDENSWVSWRDSEKVYGLLFPKKKQYNSFKNGVLKIVEELRNPGLFTQPENGKKVILGCSFSQLTHLFLAFPYNEVYDLSYRHTLLLTFHYYSTPETLLKVLLSFLSSPSSLLLSFSSPPPNDPSPSSSPSWLKEWSEVEQNVLIFVSQTKKNITEFLSDWITTPFLSFKDNTSLLQLTYSTLSLLQKSSFPFDSDSFNSLHSSLVNSSFLSSFHLFHLFFSSLFISFLFIFSFLSFHLFPFISFLSSLLTVFCLWKG